MWEHVGCPSHCPRGPALPPAWPWEGEGVSGAAGLAPRLDSTEVPLATAGGQEAWPGRWTPCAVGSALPGPLHTPSWVRPPWSWQVTLSRLFYATMFVAGSLRSVWDICRKPGTACGIPQPSRGRPAAAD